MINPAIRPLQAPRGATVYFGPQGILIAATLCDNIGFSTGGAPMVLLPITSSAERVGKLVIQAIQGSRDCLAPEELKAESAKLFELARASGWDELERSWDFIHIYCEPGEDVITVSPLHRYEAGGYGGREDADEDPIYHCRPEPKDVGEVIKKIVLGPPMEILP